MTSLPVTTTTRPRSLQGWALDKLLLLDAATPGILRYTHQASPFRRQAIFLTLSHLYSTSPDHLAARLDRHPGLPPSNEPLRAIGSALMTMRVRELVQALHPGVEGLYGALNRMGVDPMHPLKYQTLVRMLSAPHQRRAKVLRQLESITGDALVALTKLDARFLYPDLVSRFRSTASVDSFNAVVDLICRIVPGVTDADLLASIRALGPLSRLETWAQRWIAKAEFTALPPIHDDEDWRVLRTGEAMQDAALRFRNCLKDKVATCALGRVAFVEWLPQPAMIELVALSGPGDGALFALEGIHGYRNGRVDRQIAQAICGKLRIAGVLLPAKLGHARKHNKAAALLDVFEFDGFRGAEVPDDVDAFIDEAVRDLERELAVT